MRTEVEAASRSVVLLRVATKGYFKKYMRNPVQLELEVGESSITE